MYNFIAIEGNIGVGKTTLATKLSNDLKAKLVLEEFNDNLFLPKFYKNKKKYAFPLEISFLAERYNQLSQEIFNQGQIVKVKIDNMEVIGNIKKTVRGFIYVDPIEDNIINKETDLKANNNLYHFFFGKILYK